MLKEISMFEFNDFSKQHFLSNIYQTPNYAILKTEDNYEYEYIGYFENNTLMAASLILIKKISLTQKYAYAPRGFLLDYSNHELLKNFTQAIINYYKKDKVTFIKIDPLIITKEYNSQTKEKIIKQDSEQLINLFKQLGYKKLKNNLYFESQLPRFECLYETKYNNLKSFSKNTRNKVNNSLTKGLLLEKVSREELSIIYEFIKKKTLKDFKYYNDVFKVFDSNQMIDLFLVKVDYEQFMENAKNNYEEELELNKIYNDNLKENSNTRNLNNKMKSDKRLITYKNAIMEASRKYSDNELQEFIAGAIVIKYKDTAYIFESGYNISYRHLNPNYFLHYSLIEYYKEDFKYIHLNAITGDFSHENKYYGLNEFKLGFNPKVYEYIGELDLIIDDKAYNNLLMTGKLHKEFDNKSSRN